MKNEQEIKEKAKLLNMDIIDIRVVKGQRTQLLLQCKTHLNKPARWVDRYNFLYRTTTCGCHTQSFTKEDLLSHPKLNNDIEILGDYINAATKLLCRCKKCGYEWNIAPNKLMRGDRCPKCNQERNRIKLLKPQENFEIELENVNPTLVLEGQYQGLRKGIYCRCKICNQTSYNSSAYRVLRGESGCHYCNSSIGENLITLFLQKRHIVFEREKTFEGCFYRRQLFFDFYLPDYNLCIEMQGEQHFKPVDFAYNPTEESRQRAFKNFSLNLKRDETKRIFCKNHNIQLLEISYKQKAQIDQILTQYLNLSTVTTAGDI